jgi:hypothetical protein
VKKEKKMIVSTNEEVAQKRFSYGLDEISAMTGLSTAFLRKEARAGNLKTKKFGARRLVLNEDLEIYLKGDNDEGK